MSIVELKHVSKRYGSVHAMDRISFSIPRGVVFALLGENGAGKTTTIKTMLGLEHPDAGSVRILGLNPATNRRANPPSDRLRPRRTVTV